MMVVEKPTKSGDSNPPKLSKLNAVKTFHNIIPIYPICFFGGRENLSNVS